MPEVKIYGYATSPFVRKVGAFLYYKRIPFTHVPVNPIDPAATIGHTDGTRVPVLEIDGEYRRESSELAFWLDEVFPDRPLCPAEHAEQVRRADDWISSTFLPAVFRPAIDAPLTLELRFRFWRLAAILSAHTPLPEQFREAWPLLVKAAPFIQAMAQHMDLTEPIPDMQARVLKELVEMLGDGPYMCGLAEPTMLDLAVFPNLVFEYMFGLSDQLPAAAHPALRAWLARMADHLPENPTLAADDVQIHKLQDALG